MPTTYSPDLGLALMATGENAATWGTITNTNLSPLLETSIVGVSTVSYASDADKTLTITNGTTDTGRYFVLACTSVGSLTATRKLIVPLVNKTYVVVNNTAGGQSLNVIGATGTGTLVVNGTSAFIYGDGTNYNQAITGFNTLKTSGLLTAAAGVSSTLTTDATSTTTGSIITAGGISTQKALFVGTTANVAGTLTGAAANFTSIGATTPGTGAFTTATASGNVTIGGTNNVATGTIGIGVANNATVLVDGRLDANGNTYGYRFKNASAGAAATTLAVLDNGTNALQFNMFGTAFTTSGINRQGGGMVLCDGPGGLTLNTQAAQPIYFGINSVEKMRLDASGNLGIGKTPSSLLDMEQTQNTTSKMHFTNASTGSAGIAEMRLTNSTSNANMFLTSTGYTPAYNIRADGAYIGAGGAGGLTVSTTAAQPIYFGINSVEAARFDSSSRFQFGTTTSVGAASFGVTMFPNGSVQVSQNTTGTAAVLAFYNPNGSVGTITTNGSATAYNTSSDARLKTNISDAASASALIDAIQVRQFDWKSDDSHQRYGMVAQELLEVAPEAVHQPVNPEDMMGVDYSKLVPMLIKEVQSLRTRLAALENK